MDAPDSETRLDRFYSWLINKAIDNLLKKGIDNKSPQKYTKNNEPPGDISNPRGSSQDTQSQENHHLQDVQGRKTAGSEVWQGLEDKQQEINKDFGG